MPANRNLLTMSGIILNLCLCKDSAPNLTLKVMYNELTSDIQLAYISCL